MWPSRPPIYLVNIDSLDVQQLSQVKKQLEEEIEHLGSSFAQLHAAQAKFRDCLRCVQTRSASSGGKHCAPSDHSSRELMGGLDLETQSVLIPLTNSLYVRGQIPQTDQVMVDIGTGYMVQKVIPFDSSGRFRVAGANSYCSVPAMPRPSMKPRSRV